MDGYGHSPDVDINLYGVNITFNIWDYTIDITTNYRLSGMAIFFLTQYLDLFEGQRPFFTGMRPGSTSAHLNHEFLW